MQLNGERAPADVYKDFKSSVLRILGMQDNPPVFSNGKVAPIPADVVTTELPTVVRTDFTFENHFLFTSSIARAILDHNILKLACG